MPEASSVWDSSYISLFFILSKLKEQFSPEGEVFRFGEISVKKSPRIAQSLNHKEFFFFFFLNQYSHTACGHGEVNHKEAGR